MCSNNTGSPNIGQAIPANLSAMISYPQWINYKLVHKPNGKTDKLPINPKTGQVCNAHDKSVWLTYDEAVSSGQSVAFVFSTSDPFFFLDIDNCKVSQDKWNEQAVYLCKLFTGCAIEISQSGQGLHIFGTAPADIPHSCRRSDLGLEMYTSKRFCAITENGWIGDPNFIPSIETYSNFISDYFPPKALSLLPGATKVDFSTEAVPEWNGPEDDEELIKRMLLSRSTKSIMGIGISFKDLWEADPEALSKQYPDAAGAQIREFDWSQADMALCSHLAFWTGKNCERMKRLWGMSALGNREKFNREDYVQRTILNAVANCTDVYQQQVTTKWDSDWEHIVPFNSYNIRTLPMEFLPGVIGKMAKHVSIATETPIELATGLLLAVLSTACQKKVSVHIKQGYSEPVNIWVVVALDPANRKSSVLSTVTKPLIEWEMAQKTVLEQTIRDAESKRKNQESRLKSLRMRYGKAKQEKLKEIEQEIFEIEKNLTVIPVYPQVSAQDVTPEHLGTLMGVQEEKMAILSAEGGIFDTIGGRYSNGVPNLDLFLQSHSGDSVKVDRGSREPVHLKNPALTLGLSPQPDVLRSIADKPGFRGRGLLARFIYLLPKSNLGNRTLDTPPVPDSIIMEYEKIIHTLLGIKPENPICLMFSKASYEKWLKFARSVESDLGEGGKFEHISDWAGKLPGLAARIAGLLHCAENCKASEIDINTMEKAVNLSRIFSQHALYTFDLMGTDKSLEKAKKIWRWVEREKSESFTKRDCFNALKGTFHRVSNIEEPLNILRERHYIRAEIEKTGGRPSTKYYVNPEIRRGWNNEN